MTNVDAYITNIEGTQGEIMTVLNDIIMNNDRMESKLRYGIPFYFQKSWVCYLNPLKMGGIELCFLRAIELSNENGLLDFKKRKQVAGITYSSLEDINLTHLIPVIQEALILDESVKYESKRNK
ncbi:hypothetical protein SAMN04488029_1870 [Reichenbachiella faecimaris]|uniref:YdhG-like domain-containing protein n=1 Tax=Reichenbachiella faecimaris TaxID=692418 RepID=A0A1W2GBV6_REIFA|nr:DUF1801 domain-containing protein [Reichenbachiella faecimaris]SMD34147.1 hypothetical protein SAMN04488029_1870 [Reichenbachiella faecimaris]